MTKNSVLLTPKAIIAALLIQLLLITSALTIGFQLTSKNVVASPQGVTSAALPIAKGGTEGITAAAARTNLELFSKTEVDQKLAKRVYDIGTFTTFAYATLYPLFATYNTTTLSGISNSTTAQAPTDVVTNVTAVKSGTTINISAIDNNGVIYTANYSSENPTWLHGNEIAQGKVSYSTASKAYTAGENVLSSATQTFTVPRGTTPDQIIITNLSYGGSGFQEYTGNPQFLVTVSGTTATLKVWVIAHKGFEAPCQFNYHWAVINPSTPVNNSWSEWENFTAAQLAAGYTFRGRYKGDRVQLQISGYPSAAMALGTPYEITRALPVAYRASTNYVGGTANVSNAGPIANMQVSATGYVWIVPAAKALTTSNKFDESTIEYSR
jgi:hypothetical protein